MIPFEDASSPDCFTNTYNIIQNSSNFQSITQNKNTTEDKNNNSKEDLLLDYDQMQNQLSEMWYKFHSERRLLKKTCKSPQTKYVPRIKKNISEKIPVQQSAEQLAINQLSSTLITSIPEKIQKQEYADLDQTMLELFNTRLNQLNGSDSQDLLIIDEGEGIEPEMNNNHPHQYLKRHKMTDVPVGDKYQVTIPKFLGDEYFNQKYLINKERLKLLKIHERVQQNQNIEIDQKIFYEKFGNNRNTQQFFMVRQNYKPFEQTLNFQQFIQENYAKYYEYFHEIDRKKQILEARASKKKKKTLIKSVSVKPS